ncbi:hypothetical protein [Bombilactobacillus thymidiniphilus]|uniref:Uncharacterized protein n=1 Tax=Bombilactobacillus thymidiniphilus TaxID=2923363 RepID=A0ABY4PD77_9LACO|nr:hypothetical protein [Bombilactobacillus thymidiniphilus]UQS83675.1 hypothetical protein MOO47_00285 [Bombilactobacillus thymidiniphilus]
MAALSAHPQLKLPTTNEFIDFHKLVTILAVTDGDLVNVDVLRRIEDLLSNDDDEYNHEQIANKVNDLRTSIRK